MNGKVARGALVGLLFMLIGITAIPIIRGEQYKDREIVVQETLQCVSSVSIGDPTVGRQSVFLNPMVSKVLIAVDPENSKRRVVRVEPTNAECK